MNRKRSYRTRISIYRLNKNCSLSSDATRLPIPSSSSSLRDWELLGSRLGSGRSLLGSVERCRLFEKVLSVSSLPFLALL